MQDEGNHQQFAFETYLPLKHAKFNTSLQPYDSQ